ncbi:hypothetical protein CHH83_17050 [Bacillus sp. 7586-K]|nr:hypothetical protein CHH83_17050 [Bacillus sp. 7586-K]
MLIIKDLNVKGSSSVLKLG